ncbi:MAG: lipopolysaccharide heptosyltransferase I [Polaromonas sp.]|nr:MAG: lipopolysaccharide heptosyltransferase I [Polaromonas sp.]
MKILLVKLSSLGDVVHTLPVVQDILTALPNAQIDWVVEPAFAPVLLLCPGVHGVVPCDLRRWRKAPLASSTRRAYRAFKVQLRLTAYDAVIDLQGLSKSALVAWLAKLAPGGKRYALANQTDGSGYEAPTRWVADVAIRMAPHIHAVQRARALAAQALGYRLAGLPDYGLKMPPGQHLQALAAIENIANSVAFIHGTSRADKTWPLAHWVALGQRLHAAGYSVVLAHGNAAEQATSEAIARALNLGSTASNPVSNPAARVLPMLSLDALASVLATCTGVIGVDSGVSHLAVALDMPHVQIYNFDTAWRTGPESAGKPGMQQVSVFAQPAPGVQAVWQAWLGCIAAGAST